MLWQKNFDVSDVIYALLNWTSEDIQTCFYQSKSTSVKIFRNSESGITWFTQLLLDVMHCPSFQWLCTMLGTIFHTYFGGSRLPSISNCLIQCMKKNCPKFWKWCKFPDVIFTHAWIRYKQVQLVTENCVSVVWLKNGVMCACDQYIFIGCHPNL